MRTAVIVLGLLLAASTCTGDTIVLKDGRQLQGKVVARSSRKIAIKTDTGELVTVKTDEVARILKGEPGASQQGVSRPKPDAPAKQTPETRGHTRFVCTFDKGLHACEGAVNPFTASGRMEVVQVGGERGGVARFQGHDPWPDRRRTEYEKSGMIVDGRNIPADRGTVGLKTHWAGKRHWSDGKRTWLAALIPHVGIGAAELGEEGTALVLLKERDDTLSLALYQLHSGRLTRGLMSLATSSWEVAEPDTVPLKIPVRGLDKGDWVPIRFAWDAGERRVWLGLGEKIESSRVEFRKSDFLCLLIGTPPVVHRYTKQAGFDGEMDDLVMDARTPTQHARVGLEIPSPCPPMAVRRAPNAEEMALHLAEDPWGAQVEAALQMHAGCLIEAQSSGGWVYDVAFPSFMRFGGAMGVVPCPQGRVCCNKVWNSAGVALGLLAAYDALGDEVLLRGAERAGKLFLTLQRDNGSWVDAARVDPVTGRIRYVHPSWGMYFQDHVQSHPILLLWRLHQITGDTKYWAAAQRGVAFLLKYQNPNGSWSHHYDPTRDCGMSGYGGHRHNGEINDYATTDPMQVMLVAYRLTGKKEYLASYLRAADWLVSAFIDRKAKGWAQQYDANNMPITGRQHEPAAVSLSEGTDAVPVVLVQAHKLTEDRKYLDPVLKWQRWMAENKLGPNAKSKTGGWYSYYDIETGRPIRMANYKVLPADPQDLADRGSKLLARVRAMCEPGSHYAPGPASAKAALAPWRSQADYFVRTLDRQMGSWPINRGPIGPRIQPRTERLLFLSWVVYLDRQIRGQIPWTHRLASLSVHDWLDFFPLVVPSKELYEPLSGSDGEPEASQRRVPSPRLDTPADQTPDTRGHTRFACTFDEGLHACEGAVNPFTASGRMEVVQVGGERGGVARFQGHDPWPDRRRIQYEKSGMIVDGRNIPADRGTVGFKIRWAGERHWADGKRTWLAALIPHVDIGAVELGEEGTALVVLKESDDTLALAVYQLHDDRLTAYLASKSSNSWELAEPDAVPLKVPVQGLDRDDWVPVRLGWDRRASRVWLGLGEKIESRRIELRQSDFFCLLVGTPPVVHRYTKQAGFDGEMDDLVVHAQTPGQDSRAGLAVPDPCPPMATRRAAAAEEMALHLAEDPWGAQVEAALRMHAGCLVEAQSAGGWVHDIAFPSFMRFADRISVVPSARDRVVCSKIWNSAGVALGLLAAYDALGGKAFLEAGEKAGKLFLAMQRSNGSFVDTARVDPATGRIRYIHPWWGMYFQGHVQSHPILLLWRLHQLTGEARYRTAAQRGVEFLLKYQNPSGSWSHHYDLHRDCGMSGYGGHRHDGQINNYTTTDLMQVMLVAYRLTGKRKYLTSYLRAADWLVSAFIDRNAKGWAQQYDANNMPITGRQHEPAAVSLGDGIPAVPVVLVQAYKLTGDRKYLDPVLKWQQWMVENKLEPNAKSKTGGWYSYYDIETGRPIRMANYKVLPADPQDLADRGSKLLARVRAMCEQGSHYAPGPASAKAAIEPWRSQADYFVRTLDREMGSWPIDRGPIGPRIQPRTERLLFLSWVVYLSRQMRGQIPWGHRLASLSVHDWIDYFPLVVPSKELYEPLTGKEH